MSQEVCIRNNCVAWKTRQGIAFVLYSCHRPIGNPQHGLSNARLVSEQSILQMMAIHALELEWYLFKDVPEYVCTAILVEKKGHHLGPSSLVESTCARITWASCSVWDKFHRPWGGKEETWTSWRYAWHTLEFWYQRYMELRACDSMHSSTCRCSKCWPTSAHTPFCLPAERYPESSCIPGGRI